MSAQQHNRSAGQKEPQCYSMFGDGYDWRRFNRKIDAWLALRGHSVGGFNFGSQRKAKGAK